MALENDIPTNQHQVDADRLAELIRSRITLKVLDDVESPVLISDSVAATNNAKVLAAIQSAGWAPFHYDRAVDGIAEPWRAHVLWHQDCQKVARQFHDWFDDVKPNNKLPKMLSACGALVLVTWIPQFRNQAEPSNPTAPPNDAEPSKEKQLQVDEEHLAATSAMVQNLILILTAQSMGTYWSSGGQFRTSAMFEKLGISNNQRLLAALFVEYPQTIDEPKERLPGKQRSNRSTDSKWLREVEL